MEATQRGTETLVRLTTRARHELRPGEALLFDWVRLAICCAVAGEVSLRLTSRHEVEDARRYVPLVRDRAVPVYAHRRAFPHLAGRRIEVDCRRSFGIRGFRSNLPGDIGLRASLGRPPAGRLREDRV
jgi:hypothetical protein